MAYHLFWKTDIAAFFDWMDDGRVINEIYCRVKKRSKWTVRNGACMSQLNIQMKKEVGISKARRWKGGSEK